MSADSTNPLPDPRLIARAAGVRVPPIIWEVGPDRVEQPEFATIVQACVRLGASEFYLPAASDVTVIERFAQTAAPHVLLGMQAEHLLPRGSPAARQRIRAAREGRTSGVLLEDVASVELKGGRVFQRMAQLRDEGLVQFLALDAADVAAAEWMVEHTPAHAVCVPYGLEDQTAGYALLATAEELATAVFARRPARTIWTPPDEITPDLDLGFRLGDARVTACIEPLPGSEDELESRVRAASDSMPAPARARWWSAFQQQVPAPPKARGAHPPEFGA